MEAKEAPQRKATRAQRLQEKRSQRKPMTSRVQKLSVDLPDGYTGRWFNDVGSRIQDAQAAGWEFVDQTTGRVAATSDDLGTVVRQRVDRKLTNEAVYAYLMIIETELYDEDQAKKLDALVGGEKDIVRGKAEFMGDKVDGDLVYVKEADLRSGRM